MSFHTLAYYSSVASTSLTKLSAVQDIYPQDSNNFVLKSNMNLLASAVVGGIVSQARINQPSLNLVSLPFIEPLNVASSIPTNGNICVYSPVPMPVKGNEDLELDAANSSSTATGVYGLLWVSDGVVPIAQGPVYTIRGTASGTLTANSWTNVGTITWSSTLTQGMYQLVGIRGISAGCISVRAVLLNQWMKPGVPGFTAEGQRHHPFFENRLCGGFGQFNSYSLPQFEILSSSADTSETIYMDVVKVG